MTFNWLIFTLGITMYMERSVKQIEDVNHNIYSYHFLVQRNGRLGMKLN